MYRYGDPTVDAPAGGAGGSRWDTERFLRERDVRHEPGRRERRSAVEVIDRVEKRAPSLVDDYLNAQEKYGPPARRPERVYEDAHLVSNAAAIVPFKEHRRSSRSPPRKPKLLRRQSSLDTFDRAAARYASDYYQYDRDDYGPPLAPVTARRHSPPPEPDIDSVRVAEPDYYGDEEYRRMRGRDRSATPRGRSYSLREEIVKERVERPYPRRGKTKVSKRLVHPRALNDLGYAYEEDTENNIIILQALSKDNIHELVNLSRDIRQRPRVEEIKEKERIVTKTRRESVSVERTRSKSQHRSKSAARPIFELVEPREHRHVSSPVTVMAPAPVPAPVQVIKPRPRRLSSPIRYVHHHHVEEIIQPNADVQLMLPERHRRELRTEMRPTEEHRLITPDDLRPGEVLEIRRDHKAPTQRLIRAMMATLT
ncbi:hypothetical protein LOZ12_002663 [Ophidiomyces ophidiicola]|uniref:Uncharacterized protein n=1 Tax=Ophidiomyces ophidiicola TaxID=1387563 RepID=A0ACB8UX34_9EURO|nr:hypothetical protein LOZ62_003343 [Ophidiomyces ophidiicola]KAI1967480.1 hypothetical protein LOZ56_005607 [Ophidiomyces ophidiicola]KAI2004855.1 hypothetical protein LOZ50_004022 [Ophidiomyces ophidiicola]KAI2018231.1 hypothetical protein LOZ46_003976 [Ophidiomyces ophidiicola]KAI2048641.1 hypothetical protein LOZ38_004246 [Ophidiomyces ophidiicola]